MTTEHQQTTVPVSQDEVTLEREPISDANRGDAYDGPDLGGGARGHAARGGPGGRHRGRPGRACPGCKQTVAGQETVGGDVRKEQIEVDDTELRRR